MLRGTVFSLSSFSSRSVAAYTGGVWRARGRRRRYNDHKETAMRGYVSASTTAGGVGEWGRRGDGGGCGGVMGHFLPSLGLRSCECLFVLTIPNSIHQGNILLLRSTTFTLATAKVSHLGF